MVDDDALDDDAEQKDRHDGDERGQRWIDAEHRIAEKDEIAPSMKNSPWAKFNIFIVPQMSVRPLANSAYIDPTMMPLTIWATTSWIGTPQTPRYERRTDSSVRKSAVRPDLTITPVSRR